MTTDPQTELSEPDNPAAWALARHIADHPVSTIQAAFRYLNAPVTVDLHDPAPSAVAQSAPADRAWTADGRLKPHAIPAATTPDAPSMTGGFDDSLEIPELPAPAETALRDRIAETMARADGWEWAAATFTSLSTPTADRYRRCAEAVLAVLPAADRAEPELASLAVNAGRALADEKRHYEIACQENAQLRAVVERVRHLHDALDAETGLTSPDDEITRGAAARTIAAALDGYTPPAAAPAVSSVGQAAHTTRAVDLREAADIAEALPTPERYRHHSAGGVWDEATFEVARVLRRMADETPQPEAEATESVIYEVVGDWGVDSADSAEGARAAVAKWLRAYPKCGAYAQQRVYRDWPDGSEYYGPWTDLPELPAVGAQQPKEAEAPRRCAHTDVVYGRCILPMPGHDDRECFHEKQPARVDEETDEDGLCGSEYPGDGNFVGQLCALPKDHFGEHRCDETFAGTSYTALLGWPNRERP